MEALSSNYRDPERLPQQHQPLPTSNQQGKSSGGGGEPAVQPIRSENSLRDPKEPTLALLLDTGRKSGPIATHLRDDLQKLYQLGGPGHVEQAFQQLRRSRATVENTANRLFAFESIESVQVAPSFIGTSIASTPSGASSSVVAKPKLVHLELEDLSNIEKSSFASVTPGELASDAAPSTDLSTEALYEVLGGTPSQEVTQLAATSGIPAPHTGSWSSATTVIFAKAGEILPHLKGESVTWHLGSAA